VLIILLQFASAWPGAAQDSPRKNAEQFRGWKHSGTLFVLTSQKGPSRDCGQRRGPAACVLAFPTVSEFWGDV